MIELSKDEGLPESTWGPLRRFDFKGSDEETGLSVIADGLEVRELEEDVS